MSWRSADELAQYVETDDLIEFRAKGFGFLRRKRWARVIRINHENTNLSLIDQIQVVELRDPKSKVRFASETTQPLSELMKGKLGHLLNKKIQAKEKKPGVFGKIANFFSRIIDRIQDFFHNVSAKIQEFHEEKLSKWGYNIRKVGYHLCIFLFETVLGLLIITSLLCGIFLILWWFALAVSLIVPGMPLIFPLSFLV